MSSTAATRPAREVRVPESPYREIEPFRFLDRDFFFGRELEVGELAARLLVSRVVVLFGESGAGKSSLINAGLIPRLLKEDLQPERIACRTEASAPFVVERIAASELAGDFLASSFSAAIAADSQGEAVTVTPEQLLEVARRKDAPAPVFIFDQFEEIFTRFTEQPDLQRVVLSTLFEIMTDPGIRAKVLIGIREDFLAHLEVVAKAYPKVFDQRVRLLHLAPEDAIRAVLSPFDKPLFASAISQEAAKVIVEELGSGQPGARVHSTELQIICDTLWREFSPTTAKIGPDHYRGRGGKQAIIAGFLERKLGELPPDSQSLAVRLLEELITDLGTRDFVSDSKLRGALQAREGARKDILDRVLGILDRQRILVRSSEYGTVYYYIASEYLIPAIKQRRLAEQERRARTELRTERRRKQGWAWAAVFLAALGALAVHQWMMARENATLAGLLRHIDATLVTDPELATLLALQAVDMKETRETLEALQRAQSANRLLRTLRGHENGVLHVAYSPQGDKVASAAEDGTAWIWDPETGARLQELRKDDTAKAHASQVLKIAFAPDGSRVATVGLDGWLRLWDAGSGKLEWEKLAHERGALAVAFHPLAEVLATSGSDERICKWGARSGEALGCTNLDGWFANEITFHPTGKLLAAAGFKGFLGLFNWPALAKLGARESDLELSDEQQTITFSLDGKWAAAGGMNRELSVVSLESEESHTITGHANTIFQAVFDEAGRVITASADGTAKAWDPRTGRHLFTLAGHTNVVNSLACDAGCRSIATGSWDRTIRIWNADSHQHTVQTLALHPSGHLYSGARDGTVRVWDPRSNRMQSTLARLAGRVEVLALSRNGRLLAIATDSFRDDVLSVWDTHANESETVSTRYRAVALSFSDNSSQLAAALEDGTLMVWEAGRWEKEKASTRAHTGMFAVAHSPDGSMLATAGHDGTVKLWDSSSMEIRLIDTLVQDAGLQFIVGFSPDGRRLVAGGLEGKVRVWDVESRKLLRELPAHALHLNSFDFSSDGRKLATGGGDNTVKLWDLESGRLESSIRHLGSLNAVVLSADGKLLITASDDSTRPNVYYLNHEELLAAARRSLTRQLTETECRTYFNRDSCPTPH